MDLTDEKQQLLRCTRRADTIRSIAFEPVKAAFQGSGLGVLVALQLFHGADWQKALLASVGTTGMLLSPLGVSLAGRLGMPVARAAAWLMMLSAPGLLLATGAQTLVQFMVGIFLSIPLFGMAIPLVTSMWQQNVPVAVRGRSFSMVTFAGGLSAMLAAFGISLWLGDDPGRFRPVTAIFAVLMVVAGAALWRVPSQPLERPSAGKGHHGLAVLSLLWRDKFFGYLCIAQMLIGFANLSTIPLRTEFLGSDERGMGYAAGWVFILTLVVPQLCRFSFIPLWGRLFDHLNFGILRMSVSLCFVVSLLSSFSPFLPLQVIGAAFYGIAMGGGNIAWSLWVTKLAPAERTADYMAVHTFLTGFRGLVGPQLAFLALGMLSIAGVGYWAAGLAFAAVAMMLPAISRFHSRPAV